MEKEKIAEIQKSFDAVQEKQNAKGGNGVSLSLGYAVAGESPQFSIEELVNLADRRMYANKEIYYRSRGLDRHGAAAEPTETTG